MQGREVQLVSAEESEKTLHPQNRNGMPRIKDLGQGSSQTRVSNGSSCSDVLETQTWVLAPSLCPCSGPLIFGALLLHCKLQLSSYFAPSRLPEGLPPGHPVLGSRSRVLSSVCPSGHVLGNSLYPQRSPTWAWCCLHCKGLSHPGSPVSPPESL